MVTVILTDSSIKLFKIHKLNITTHHLLTLFFSNWISQIKKPRFSIQAPSTMAAWAAWNRIRMNASDLTFFDYSITYLYSLTAELNRKIREHKSTLHMLERRINGASGSSTQTGSYATKYAETMERLASDREKLNHARELLTRTRQSREKALEDLRGLVTSFQTDTTVKILELSDLVAIGVMASVHRHRRLNFALGSTARNVGSLIRLSRFMRLNPAEGINEISADRVYSLLPNSDRIIILD